MVLPPTNQMQKFPKVLRFYTRIDWRYYWFWGKYVESYTHVTPSLNGQLTEEQWYMLNQMRKHPTGVIHMWTGRWKSWVIYWAIADKWCKTLVLCHNIQTADDMYKWIINNTTIDAKDVGLVHSRSKHPRTWIVDVITHASFVKNYKEYLNTYEMICYDECDYNLSFPAYNDYECMVGALIEMSPKYLYGFTGTPYRAEGGAEVLNRIFGEIWTYSNEYNYIPKITQVWYKYEWLYNFETFWELMQNLNELEPRKEKQIKLFAQYKRKRNLILTKSVKESESIHEFIPWSILLNGALDSKTLKENMDLLNKSIEDDTGFTIVWTIDKIGRGVDIPPIDTLFLFSPVRFRWTVVQAVGRALRKYPGKTDVAIYDWCDMPILKKQQRERLKDYTNEYGIDKSSFKFLVL